MKMVKTEEKNLITNMRTYHTDLNAQLHIHDDRKHIQYSGSNKVKMSRTSKNIVCISSGHKTQFIWWAVFLSLFFFCCSMLSGPMCLCAYRAPRQSQFVCVECGNINNFMFLSLFLLSFCILYYFSVTHSQCSVFIWLYEIHSGFCLFIIRYTLHIAFIFIHSFQLYIIIRAVPCSMFNLKHVSIQHYVRIFQ